ncbi:MAG: methenyltetrahydromethanopterin cyclohydrolase [Pirellulaceae bacterium]|nr:methenyltetrahydromethanopterin cyclohydrolase [Pirellulaceae bacterium]
MNPASATSPSAHAAALSATGLNQAAMLVCQRAAARAAQLGISYQSLPCGAHVLDFGVKTQGGLAAGLELARITLADMADVSLVAGDQQVFMGPWVQVSTERPVQACMFAQYAGWPVKHEKFFAMGSGPMRSRRGREPVLEHWAAHDSDTLAVGSLECDTLPDCSVATSIAQECQVMPSQLWLAVAPTRSLAGCVQVVARSVETSLHKLHELGFDLSSVRSAYGIAPVPPPTPDFGAGIGRTNDAILYGGAVTLWLEGDDDHIAHVGAKLPSNSSCDFGLPFAEIFKRYEYDFYKVDPGLFSPACVTLVNLKTGRSWRFGSLRADLIARSFGVT